MDLGQDLHVHSTYSDGADSLEANVAAAEARGLTRLGCVDHVRADSDWVSEYVSAVRAAAEHTRLELTAGIEAKILDASGTLDLPAHHGDADVIYAADHQFPWTDGPRAPGEIGAAIADGSLDAAEAIDRLVDATIRAMRRHEGRPLVLAHLFSILPKIGVEESQVSSRTLSMIGTVAARTGTMIEVSERWRCPSVRTARALRDAGATLVCSTDSHRAAAVGRYFHVAQVAAAVNAAR